MSQEIIYEKLTLLEVPELPSCPSCGEKQLVPVWVVGRGNNTYGAQCKGCGRVYARYYSRGFGLRPAALSTQLNDDLIGVREAADILGWDPRRVATYRKRGAFPEPIAELAMGPVWTRDQVEEYKKKFSAPD